jgi:tape measure domain-containing protein
VKNEYQFILNGKDKTANAFNSANSNVDKFEKTVKRAGAAIIAAFSVRKMIAYSDTYTLLQNRIKTVTDSQDELVDTTNRLARLAQETRSELTSTTELYTKLARSTEELNVSSEDLYTITEVINKSFQIQGATTAEAAGATLQLSQALASGVLRGQEFNSVSEQGTEILRAIGRELGKNIGELRAMAKEGLITADIVVGALLNQADVIRDTYSETDATISQSWQAFSDSALIAIGRIDDKMGASSGMKQWLNDLTTVIKTLNGSAGELEATELKLRSLNDYLLSLRERGAPRTLISSVTKEIRELNAQINFVKVSSISQESILDGVFSNLSGTAGGVGQAEAQAFAETAFTSIKTALTEQAQFEQESGEISALLSDGLFTVDPDDLNLALQDERNIWADHWQEMFADAEAYAQHRMLMQQSLETNIFNTAASFASQTAGAIANAAEEGSAVQKAAYVAQQGLLFASTIINSEAAATAALALPPIGLGPVAGLPYATIIRGMGYASAGIIAGQTFASFDGGGFTPDIPRTGGLDGKGGFYAVMHGNEEVIDHTKSNSRTNQSSAPKSEIKVILNNYSGQPANYVTRDDVIEITVGEMSNQSSRSRNALHATSNVTPRGRN